MGHNSVSAVLAEPVEELKTEPKKGALRWYCYIGAERVVRTHERMTSYENLFFLVKNFPLMELKREITFIAEKKHRKNTAYH